MAEWYPEDGWKDDGKMAERCMNDVTKNF